ncbi:hypothetical protein TREMEDRAFT_59299 [Tremella mesenterica DSM 1558]|uniref:uncharacterized protein n=1 Tax=Tremella mesenterica (strain ATCC 24925 / CBS 8224 / DSM 1558 / NBRC 9311 / NRRL Y-6157 / RJB 2259-6 / UBC 559-6) TaxID=578456 RepID=UPI0003F49147|nr:uncharacterized protein TREMEDRAFT_59299 [Tremella mesenterica DSM 1558]EIW73138.1 hypothetical protein TREMEDRAFT_59299 [Tremella mesenterica DSM 1558]
MSIQSIIWEREWPKMWYTYATATKGHLTVWTYLPPSQTSGDLIVTVPGDHAEASNSADVKPPVSSAATAAGHDDPNINSINPSVPSSSSPETSTQVPAEAPAVTAMSWGKLLDNMGLTVHSMWGDEDGLPFHEAREGFPGRQDPQADHLVSHPQSKYEV